MSTFLENWYGEFRPHLTFIVPDGPALSLQDRSFLGVQKALIAYDGARNIYFSVNAVRQDCLKKATKFDITHAIGLHVDIDYRAGEEVPLEQERIANMARNLPPGVPPPTVRIFTGGGEGWFYRFGAPVLLGSPEAFERIEGRNRWLEYALGGDHCHNIDRIMRCPDTWNLPNAKKRSKGRTRIMSCVLEADWTRLYAPEDFSTAPERTAIHLRSTKEGVPDKVAVIVPASITCYRDIGIADYQALCDLIRRPDYRRFGNDRSRAVWYVANELARCGVPADKIAGVLLHRSLGISEHVHAQPRPAKYASRQAQRAVMTANTLEEPVYEMTDADVAAYEKLTGGEHVV